MTINEIKAIASIPKIKSGHTKIPKSVGAVTVEAPSIAESFEYIFS